MVFHAYVVLFFIEAALLLLFFFFLQKQWLKGRLAHAFSRGKIQSLTSAVLLFFFAIFRFVFTDGSLDPSCHFVPPPEMTTVL